MWKDLVKRKTRNEGKNSVEVGKRELLHSYLQSLQFTLYAWGLYFWWEYSLQQLCNYFSLFSLMDLLG